VFSPQLVSFFSVAGTPFRLVAGNHPKMIL